MRRLTFSLKSVPFALLGLVVLSYGIYIPWFGFYGDDWIYIYNYHLLGPGSFPSFVAIDRPYSAWIYTLTTSLFDSNAWMYHLLLLVLRWGSAYLFWRILRTIWPQKERQATWAAMLFAVYPGFLQQPIAVQYILHFSVLDLFLISFLCMLLSLHYRRWFWLLLIVGVICSLGMFSIEYFVGLELLRPVILWIVLGNLAPGLSRRWLHVILNWFPYLVSLVAFGIWRVFIFKFPTYQPEMLKGLSINFQGTLIELARRFVGDIKTVTYGAWRQIFTFPSQTKDLLAYSILLIIVFSLLLIYLKKYHSSQLENPVESQHFWQKWTTQSLLVSLFAIVLAGLPFWATFIRVELPFPWDRSTLPFMLGSSLLVVSLVDMVIQPVFRLWIVVVLITFSIGLHFQNALIYKSEWENLRTYFTQLVWRAPDLKPGTIIVSDEIPLNRFSDNDLTPIVDWIYSPDLHSEITPYKYFDLSTRVGSALPGLEEGLPVEHSYRNHKFKSSTSAVLSVYYRLSGCLYILSPEDNDFPGLPTRVFETLPISHLTQIMTNSEVSAKLPPPFNGETVKDWCYYYEKADLARQKSDWNEVSRLAKEAESLSLTPKNSFELLPFIEGFASTGEDDHLNYYVGQVKEDTSMIPMLCKTLNRVMKNNGRSKVLDQLRGELNCVA